MKTMKLNPAFVSGLILLMLLVLSCSSDDDNTLEPTPRGNETTEEITAQFSASVTPVIGNASCSGNNQQSAAVAGTGSANIIGAFEIEYEFCYNASNGLISRISGKITDATGDQIFFSGNVTPQQPVNSGQLATVGDNQQSGDEVQSIPDQFDDEGNRQQLKVDITGGTGKFATVSGTLSTQTRHSLNQRSANLTWTGTMVMD